MKLISFRKIQGGKGVIEDGRYHVKYWAELELLTDDEKDREGRWLEQRWNWSDKGEEKWKKGDIVIDRGLLKFEKTQEGWLGPNGNVY